MIPDDDKQALTHQHVMLIERLQGPIDAVRSEGEIVS